MGTVARPCVVVAVLLAENVGDIEDFVQDGMSEVSARKPFARLWQTSRKIELRPVMTCRDEGMNKAKTQVWWKIDEKLIEKLIKTARF